MVDAAAIQAGLGEARLGRKIRWDPDREEILGDPEAARMLTRPLRPPWTF
jgi:hypothetical protein